MTEQEREEAFNQKVKRFDRAFVGLLINIVVSIVATVLTLRLAGII